jgi:peptide/nickel transport system permease protein
MVAVGIVSIPVYARLVRGQVLALRSQEFVDAARALGATRGRIIWRHVLPNTLAVIIVQSTLQVASAILTAAALGFLGLGAQPPAAEWGSMLSNARQYIRLAPHSVTFPGIAIMLTVLGFNLVGDAIRDALDPRMRL